MSEQLLWSVKNGDIDVVRKEIPKCKDINKEITGGRNALHFAADYGQTDVIECLIENGANVNLPDKYGITPLLAAIYEGHRDAVELLISKGANKTGKDPDGKPYKDCAEDDDIQKLLE